MSHFDDLIAQHCPDGVEFKELGEVINLRFGARITKQKHAGTLYPVYGGGGESFRTDDFNREDEYVISRFAMSETCVRRVDGKFWMLDSGFTFDVADEEVAKDYVAYWLFNNQRAIYACSSHSAQKNLRTTEFRRFRFPVPPLEVQREIVRLLDKFTELEAELDAELKARRAQRIALANNFAVVSRDRHPEQTQCERVTLGSLARESVEPVKVRAEHSYVSLGVKWNGEGVIARDPRSGDSIKAAKLYRARPGQLIYNRMFVVEGSFAIVPDDCDGAVVSGEFPLFELDTSRVEPYWLLQHLCDPYTLKRIEREVTGTERGSMKSRRRWKADQFANFELALPTLEVQREIVNAIRSAEAIIHSLKDELAARQKQYEYYRDRLLTFEEKAA